MLSDAQIQAREDFRAEMNTPAPDGLLLLLTFTCSKCTRWRQFAAETKIKAQLAAKNKGWKMIGGKSICKKCPA